MRVLVDTTIWSLALRRRAGHLAPAERALVDEWAQLVREGRVTVLGIIRQEVLSGIATAAAFERVREALEPFLDVALGSVDHENAARAFNACRASGVVGSAVYMLICSVAQRLDSAVFSTAPDFIRYASVLGLRLHAPR